ncbi:ArsR/SmtB family transcription factor [Paenibacillus radicis (ex Gao et al. 2016)]|uniref:Transcriptional regulator n=1 Tax=Paenibacillus radicis (ex Gao et al. 2016) TaxID=1737354 RepID=A0A917GY10_9BACL|nr:helix-turn-helix transcriptional regulator [Paenibacillus radicis (ex Gao et al. 2016)]GGG61124.1 transcriptional regulator [Paenibacillus radicis (ex Gao et al. 2016)]
MKILHHPDRADIHLSSVLYALSDPVRLFILSELRKHQERSCGDFDVPVAKSTLSHHTRTLRESGVVNVRSLGTQRLISIRTDDLEIRFPGLLTSILDAYENSDEKQQMLLGLEQ